MQPQYNVRIVRRDELDDYVALRLLALQDAPTAFGSTYASALQNGTARYAATYFGEGPSRLFGAFTNDGAIISQLSFARLTDNQTHLATIGNVFTHPDHRGRGLTTRLIAAAVAHAQGAQEILQINISVNADNATALGIYERAGFVRWGREPNALCVDGVLYDEIHLALDLRT